MLMSAGLFLYSSIYFTMILTSVDPSSTVLHVLLYVNSYYTLCWFVVEILCFVFKSYHVVYATNALGEELAMIFILLSNEYLRQFFGMKGNLILTRGLFVLFILYGPVCMLGFIFFLVLQSYVQRVEILLAGIALVLIILELILCVMTMIRKGQVMPVFSKEEKLTRLQISRQRLDKAIENEWK
jgi:hypothetical protein